MKKDTIKKYLKLIIENLRSLKFLKKMQRGNKIIGKVLSLISIANKEKIVIKKKNFFFSSTKFVSEIFKK